MWKKERRETYPVTDNRPTLVLRPGAHLSHHAQIIFSAIPFFIKKVVSNKNSSAHACSRCGVITGRGCREYGLQIVAAAAAAVISDRDDRQSIPLPIIAVIYYAPSIINTCFCLLLSSFPVSAAALHPCLPACKPTCLPGLLLQLASIPIGRPARSFWGSRNRGPFVRVTVTPKVNAPRHAAAVNCRRQRRRLCNCLPRTPSLFRRW